jgi:Zn-dependent peptidase ImmA (M78 family)
LSAGRKSLVPAFTEDTIRRMAEECLREHHPGNTIPIPIETIVEVKFEIDVVPWNDLLANYDIDGYIARDGGTIYIDGEVYQRANTNRLRFTLAHELAHLRLHPRVFAAAKYDDVEGWISFQKAIAPHELKQIETQARIMAGYMLVPRDHFQAEYERMARLLDEHRFDIANMNEAVFRRVLARLGEKFEVSPAVIARQGAREGVWEWDAIPESI